MAPSRRREFLRLMLAGVAAAGASPFDVAQGKRVFAQTQQVTTTPLNDHLHLIAGAGGNVLLVSGGERLVLVNGGSAEHSDEVLKAVAGCLKDMTRFHDVVARLGGEEFAVVAPNMDNETLVRFAERIRKAISGMAIVSGNVRLKITASVGLAIWDRKESAETLFRRADQQLYQAKKTGRNRVCA